MTKGIGYEVVGESIGTSKDYLKNVFLIYDVPAYFEVPSITPDAHLALHRSRQYPGFLIEVNKFKDLNDYLLGSFSKSSRYKLKKYKKRFEASFDVRYVMYRGAMEREKYNSIFERFRQLLEKRFDDKQITNNNLDPREWQFYHEVTYPMLLKNEASLFVIYQGDEPIGVTLNFFSEDVLFDAITVFDIDYAKFHLGSITIMALLDWCLVNNIKVFDFSKGYFDYKARWATKGYDFEYHILYDPKSFRAKALAYGLKQFFDLKQRLREKNVNDRLHRITYRFKNKTPEPLETRGYTFEELELEESTGASPEIESGLNPDASSRAEIDRPASASPEIESGSGSSPSSGFTDDRSVGASHEIDLQHPENQLIRMMVFEYLYLNDGQYRDIKVYRVPKKTDQYYIVGKTKRVLATLQ